MDRDVLKRWQEGYLAVGEVVRAENRRKSVAQKFAELESLIASGASLGYYHPDVPAVYERETPWNTLKRVHGRKR